MSNPFPVSLDTITPVERALMDDALRDFRLVRPGERQVIEVPFRDSSGRLIAVHYVFAERLGMVQGRALIQADGHLAVQLG
jgi:hypothetical protein